MKSQYRIIAFAILAYSVCFNTSFAASYTPKPTEQTSTPWKFLVAPYGWIFGINGSMTAKGTTADISMTPLDTLDLIDKLDGFFQLHLEATKNRWTLMLDPSYMAIKDTTDTTIGPFNLSATMRPSLFLMDFGVFYSAKQTFLFNNPNRPITLQAFGGGRYFYLKLKISPSFASAVNAKEGFVTPIIGGRILAKLSKSFDVSLLADAGGLGFDNVRKTWQLSALGHYAFNKTVSVAGGIRAIGIDFTRGSGANRFGMDTIYYGPLLGIVFHF